MVFQFNNISICEGNVHNFTAEYNYYSQLMEDNPYRYVLATIAIIIMTASLITCYSIIWIERYGSDKKRTVINQLVASICWTFITWNSTVQIIKLVRLLYGPLGLKLCAWTSILQRVVTTRVLLLVNAISTVRYAFIFWSKNPGAFNDDFWHKFVSLWTIMAGSIFQYVIASLPNKKLMGIDVCIGLPPNHDLDSYIINIGIEIPSLVLQLFIFTRIAIYHQNLKRKPQPTNNLKNQQLAEIEKSSLLTFSSNLGIGILAFLLLTAILSSKQIDFCKIFTFPYSLMFQFSFLIAASLVSFIIPFSFYFFHLHVRQTFAREWHSGLLELKQSFISFC